MTLLAIKGYTNKVEFKSNNQLISKSISVDGNHLILFLKALGILSAHKQYIKWFKEKVKVNSIRDNKLENSSLLLWGTIYSGDYGVKVLLFSEFYTLNKQEMF